MNKNASANFSFFRKVIKGEVSLLRYLNYYTGKLLHTPLYVYSFVINRILFKKYFRIKFYNTDGKASHFLFTAHSLDDEKVYIFKEHNVFLKKYVEMYGRHFLNDSKKYEILSKLRESFIGPCIPPLLLIKKHLFIEYIPDCDDVVSFCATPRPVHEVAKVSEQIETFFRGLHELGYVHVDIKPKNILINKQHRVYVIDWDNICQIDEAKKNYDNKLLESVLTLLQNVKQSW